MSTAVCTLFEGDYHYGVGALVNSLYQHGFRGTVWAGYRGNLPPWAIPLQQQKDGIEFEVAAGLKIRFEQIVTEVHFSNYKPAFIQHVWNAAGAGIDGIFYFDPDIVVRCHWGFFREWIRYGVALCEDVNSPIPETHPIRVGWRRFFSAAGITMTPRTHLYINAGFIGVAARDIEFISKWHELLSLVSKKIGDLREYDFPEKDRTDLFYRPDQDALNAAIEAVSIPVSLVGQEGMSFKPGGYIMVHAIGSSKPWTRSILADALKAMPPNDSDRAFLQASAAPITLYSPLRRQLNELSLTLASAIGRFWRRAGL